MKTTIKMELKKLLAANLFTSRSLNNPACLGVHFEDKGNVINLVATDGDRLIQIQSLVENADREAGRSFTIPSSLIKQIKPLRGIENCTIQINKETIAIEYGQNIFQGTEIELSFPNYERVLPDHDQDIKLERERRGHLSDQDAKGEYVANDDIFEINLDPKMISDMAKVNDLLGHKGAPINIRTNHPGKPMVITCGKNKGAYLVLIMQARL